MMEVKRMEKRPIESLRLVEVIELKVVRGAGTPDDLSRIVTQYWSKEGELLAEDDPCEICTDSSALKQWEPITARHLATSSDCKRPLCERLATGDGCTQARNAQPEVRHQQRRNDDTVPPE